MDKLANIEADKAIGKFKFQLIFFRQSLRRIPGKKCKKEDKDSCLSRSYWLESCNKPWRIKEN
jgi:hypothetical protein